MLALEFCYLIVIKSQLRICFAAGINIDPVKRSRAEYKTKY